ARRSRGVAADRGNRRLLLVGICAVGELDQIARIELVGVVGVLGGDLCLTGGCSVDGGGRRRERHAHAFASRLRGGSARRINLSLNVSVRKYSFFERGDSQH